MPHDSFPSWICIHCYMILYAMYVFHHDCGSVVIANGEMTVMSRREPTVKQVLVLLGVLLAILSKGHQWTTKMFTYKYAHDCQCRLGTDFCRFLVY